VLTALSLDTSRVGAALRPRAPRRSSAAPQFTRRSRPREAQNWSDMFSSQGVEGDRLLRTEDTLAAATHWLVSLWRGFRALALTPMMARKPSRTPSRNATTSLSPMTGSRSSMPGPDHDTVTCSPGRSCSMSTGRGNGFGTGFGASQKEKAGLRSFLAGGRNGPECGTTRDEQAGLRLFLAGGWDGPGCGTSRDERAGLRSLPASGWDGTRCGTSRHEKAGLRSHLEDTCDGTECGSPQDRLRSLLGGDGNGTRCGTSRVGPAAFRSPFGGGAGGDAAGGPRSACNMEEDSLNVGDASSDCA